jgi:hypothetical protein
MISFYLLYRSPWIYLQIYLLRALKYLSKYLEFILRKFIVQLVQLFIDAFLVDVLVIFQDYLRLASAWSLNLEKSLFINSIVNETLIC